jgi:hypothetical protein
VRLLIWAWGWRCLTRTKKETHEIDDSINIWKITITSILVQLSAGHMQETNWSTTHLRCPWLSQYENLGHSLKSRPKPTKFYSVRIGKCVFGRAQPLTSSESYGQWPATTKFKVTTHETTTNRAELDTRITPIHLDPPSRPSPPLDATTFNLNVPLTIRMTLFKKKHQSSFSCRANDWWAIWMS